MSLNQEDVLSCAAFRASLPVPSYLVVVVALLQVYLEDTHSAAVIFHGMNFSDRIVQYVNSYQTLVLAMDQPLFAIAKQIQWNSSKPINKIATS